MVPFPSPNLTVGDRIKKLQKQFSSLQRRLSSELNANSEVTPEIVLESLTLLPVELRSEYQKFMVDNLQVLERADSIRKLFHHLNPLQSFIDYTLLEHLVEELASRRLKKEMAVYVQKVQLFLEQTTVEQLIGRWHSQHEIPPHFERLTAMIDADPRMYTLRQVDDLRRRFCSEVSLRETVLIFIRLGRRNSFLIIWAVPSILAPRLKSVISSLTHFFQRENILSVILGGQQLYSIAVSVFTSLPKRCNVV